MNSKVDAYLKAGCGRCEYHNTPKCKVHNWEHELAELRKILLECDLEEELKWRVPCYTNEGRNIVLLSAFKDYCSVSFPNGALLKDDKKLLEKPGENTQAARLIKFTSPSQVAERAGAVKAYVAESIALENAGKKFEFKTTSEPMPQELEARLAGDGRLRSAFEALTPGRQRGYILHFSSAKQSKTREARIEKCIPMILAGKGFHD
ncbi:MAG: YdeI/OmpD-associated family protein [Pyrinomonadaceae bacterium]